MTKTNPFPGMNPFIEQRWSDAHTMLIGYIRDALQERLPGDLIAGAEERMVSIGAEGEDVKFRPDINVHEQGWRSGGGGAALAAPVRAPEATAVVVVLLDEELERWVEIRDTNGRLITVIDVFSPSNKLDETAREKYRRKRNTLLQGRVNIVEIDLLRGGGSLFPREVVEVKSQRGASYGVCVFRASRVGEREFYAFGLRDRLPVISIPLRPHEPDIGLELQPLINRCHERGRYHLLRYDLGLNPPLLDNDRQWVQEVLRANQLIP